MPTGQALTDPVFVIASSLSVLTADDRQFVPATIDIAPEGSCGLAFLCTPGQGRDHQQHAELDDAGTPVEAKC